MSDFIEPARAAVQTAAAPTRHDASAAPSPGAATVKPSRTWRFSLLPPGLLAGWTPYVWLIYLGTFFIAPVWMTRAGVAPWWLWPVTILGTAVFLFTYFLGHWVHGRRLIPIAITHTALGILFAPINPGSCVFFVYGASFIAQLDRARDAWRGLILIVLIGAITGLLVSAPPYFLFVALVIGLMVGGVNLHYHQQSCAQDKLRLAHAEIEQLAAIAERERIARDLHDVLGHTLSLIVLKAELAVRLSEIDAQRAAREMRDVEDVARRTLQDVRLAIRGYRTTFAEEVDRAQSMLKAARIDGNITLDADGTAIVLPAHVEETLSLVLREAVTNVVRHSRASQCDVRLDQRDRTITLTVHDNGDGSSFTPGLGLTGMRERVEAVGGTLSIESGGGTRLAAMIPDIEACESAHVLMPRAAS